MVKKVILGRHGIEIEVCFTCPSLPPTSQKQWEENLEQGKGKKTDACLAQVSSVRSHRGLSWSSGKSWVGEGPGVPGLCVNAVTHSCMLHTLGIREKLWCSL